MTAFLFGFWALGICQEPSLLDLEPLTITKSQVHLQHPCTVKSKTIETLEGSSFIEYLRLTPLDLQSRSLKSGVQTDFSLRGSNFQGVLMLLNGQRINDPQTAHHNADIPLTKEDIEKIEVLPGVSSSIFGPDAIGGAVNFILKKPKGRKIVLETSGGQHQAVNELFSYQDKIGPLGLRASWENQKSDGFSQDTDFEKRTSSVGSTLEIPDGEWDLDFGYQEKEFGAFDFYTPGLGYPSKEWTRTYLLNTGLNLDKGGLTIKPNFLWRRHYDKFMLDKTNVRSRYLNYHRTDVFTPNIYFQKQTGWLGSVGLGLEYGQEQIRSTNLGKHNRPHKSIFMDESKDLNDKFSWGMSLRFDDFAGFPEVYTGSTSFKYKVSPQDSFNLGVSRSMRVPSFTELYYNDPTTLGNADISAEKSLNYQAGFEHGQEKLSWGLTFFLRREKDFIDWVKHSFSQARWQVENITEDEVFGSESYIRFKFNDYLSLDSFYTYINKYAEGQGLTYKYGPNYIRHLSNTALSFHLPFGEQSVEFVYKQKPHRPGWFLLNARLSLQFHKNAQIFLDAANLTDKKYQEIEGIPQPGRWLEAGLRLEW